MILGRSPALWAGLVAALLNAAVVVFGVPLTLAGLAALNSLALAAIGVLANATNPTTAGTFEPTIKAPATAVVDISAVSPSAPGATVTLQGEATATSPSAAESSPGTMATPNGEPSAETTADPNAGTPGDGEG